jgi:TonB family protein
LTSRASDPIPYIAMPVGIGYAKDANGVRHPNAFCLRDAIFTPRPAYPFQLESNIGDSVAWTGYIEGNGLYRLHIDLNTGRVSQVTIVKSTGSEMLDAASTGAFSTWIFRPGKWKAVIIPTTVRKKWVGIINRPRR